MFLKRKIVYCIEVYRNKKANSELKCLRKYLICIYIQFYTFRFVACNYQSTLNVPLKREVTNGLYICQRILINSLLRIISIIGNINKLH